MAERALLAGQPLAVSRRAAEDSETDARATQLELRIERQLVRRMQAERKEERRTARSRCRARNLMEAAEVALETFSPSEAESERVCALAPGVIRTVALRPMTPLELGLLYVWMSADEALPDDGATHVPRWWSGGATGIQQRWESSAHWIDEELDEPAPGFTGSLAVATIAQVTAEVAKGRAAVERLLGASALEDGTPPQRAPPHFLGAFLPGRKMPVGFVATKEPCRGGTQASAWAIDAMGVRVAARGRGLGRALAAHCIAGAEAAGDGTVYRIDVVPAAVGFWKRLGFEEAEPSATQALYLEKGGDRPMMLALQGTGSAPIRVDRGA